MYRSFTCNVSFLRTYQELRYVTLRFVNEKYRMKHYKLSEHYGCLMTLDIGRRTLSYNLQLPTTSEKKSFSS